MLNRPATAAIIGTLGSLILWLVPFQVALAQTIGGGGAAQFLIKDGEAKQIGDAFVDADWEIGVGDNYLGLSFMGGLGEGSTGFIGSSLRYYWGVADGFYPSLGARVFYLKPGDLGAIEETTVFVGPEMSFELLSEDWPISLEPFAGYQFAIVGDNAAVLRFGVRLNEISGE